MKLFFKRNKKKSEDFISPRQELKESSKSSIRNLFDGSLLSHKNVISQLPFMLFLTFLGLLYISNHYKYEREYRKMEKLKKIVSEHRFQSVDVAAELMKMNRQSSISKRVKDAGLDLEELRGPVIKINLKEE